MKLKEELANRLKDVLEEGQLKLLPSGIQIIGSIAILSINSDVERFKKNIGEEVLKIYPNINSVYLKKGEIKGIFREPQIEILAFRHNIAEKIATIKENGCIYRFDITKLMFAKGNINERVRIAKQVKSGEIIVDMFAGIGYFSVPIGKLSNPKKVYSIELNPNAFYFLNENLKLNHISHKFETFNSDNRKIVQYLLDNGVKADRVVMGYLPPPMDFMDSAFKISKKGTIIHYECLLNEDLEKKKKEVKEILSQILEKAKIQKKSVKLLSINYVKSFKPHVNHEVLDLRVG
jgi:tRNA wybutosine-synthesizing protein 2